MIKVEFLLSTPLPSEDTANYFAEFLDDIRVQMRVPESAVASFIVADKERFGDAVGRFDPTRTYTNARGLVAAGKTMPMRERGEVGPSTILFLDTAITPGLIAAHQHGPDASMWPANDRHSLYVPFHELGHALDHSIRPEPDYDGTFRTAEGRRAIGPTFRDACAYNLDMALSELAATVAAASAYPHEVRAFDLQMNNGALPNLAAELAKLTTLRPHEVRLIRHEALSLIGFIIVQQAKLTGSAIGNAGLPAMTVEELWPGAQNAPLLRSALAAVDSSLRDLWAKYPHWDAKSVDTFLPNFAQLGIAFGYRFVDLIGRDGVWWDQLCRDQMLAALSMRSSGSVANAD